MRKIGNYSFPVRGNRPEIEQWRAHITRRALDRCVLVVAKTRIEGTWKAYCRPVPGEDHMMESDAVLRHGSPLPEDIARAMFPEFEGIPYAR